MALDLNPLQSAVAALTNSVQSLTDFASAKIAEADKTASDQAAAIAADEASAVATLAQVSDHLTQVAASINSFVAAHQPAPAPAAAEPAPAA